jgi:hypothetical protein
MFPVASSSKPRDGRVAPEPTFLGVAERKRFDGASARDGSTMERKPLVWRAVSYGAGGLAAFATRRAVVAVWSARRDEPPPDGPAAVRAPLPAVLTWAIAVAAGVAVARIVAIRSAAKVWEATVHEPPPVLDA